VPTSKNQRHGINVGDTRALPLLHVAQATHQGERGHQIASEIKDLAAPGKEGTLSGLPRSRSAAIARPAATSA
jgi:hypothetical protein